MIRSWLAGHPCPRIVSEPAALPVGAVLLQPEIDDWTASIVVGSRRVEHVGPEPGGEKIRSLAASLVSVGIDAVHTDREIWAVVPA